MDTRTRIFYGLYLLVGAFCLAALVVSWMPETAGRFIRQDRYKYGDLYDLSMVSHFKVPKEEYPAHLQVPGRPLVVDAPAEHSIVDSEVMFMGDSFFGKYFGGQFESLTGTPVYMHWFDKVYETPVDALEKLHYKRSPKTRYLVYERTERTPALYFYKTAADYARPDEKLRKYFIDKMSLEFLVTRNPVASRLIGIRNTFRFDAFGDISRLCAHYSTDPPMIFLEEVVMSNRVKKDDRFIMGIADKLAETDRTLRDKYGLKMLLVLVPNKFTVYGYRYDSYNFNYSGLEYDGFLPRLYAELDKRDVAYIDLYDDFMGHEGGLLYSRTDSHWNGKGMSIAMSRLLELYGREERRLLPVTR